MVRWARERNLGFAIRSGGHCFTGFSQHADLVIDLRELNMIRFEPDAGTVTIGAGALLGTVARYLAEHGVSVPGGICATVGMAGQTLGGGIGYFSRQGGLLADQLLSLRMVTAAGDLIDVSESRHPDLFWACRGAGNGNLGIVTDLRFRVASMPPMSLVRVVEPVEAVRAAEILYLWQHRCQLWPRHTVLHLRISKRTDTTFLIILEGLSGWPTGDLAEELSLVLRTTRERVLNDIHSGSFAKLTQRMMPSDVQIGGILLSHSHLFEEPVGERGTLDILSMLIGQPAGRVHLNIEPMGGAIADVAPDATAFPHRATSFSIQSQAFLRDDDDRDALIRSNEAMRQVLEPLATGGVYVNYPDLTLTGWGQKYWGENLPRLKAIKASYDPDTVFDHAQSIARA